MAAQEKSSSFRRDLLLVVATGLITGIIAPLVVARFQDTALRRQKEQEAALARQTNVIQAQGKMLDVLSEQLLQYEFLAFKVSYYKTLDRDKEFEMAAKQYDADSWQYFNNVRSETYKAGRLISPAQYDQLIGLNKLQADIDGQLDRLMHRQPNDTDGWSRFDHCLRELTETDTPRILGGLARDLHLSVGAEHPMTSDLTPPQFAACMRSPGSDR
jgi:hypothetical protein